MKPSSPSRSRRRRNRRPRVRGSSGSASQSAEREEAVVEITALAAGGDGVGRLDGGKVVFVRGVAVGDRVRIQIPANARSFVHGELVERLEPGPSRVEPVCEVFGECGGCAWQHIDYGAQVAAKRAIVGDALRRIGKLDPLPEVRMVASPSPYGYRGRTRVQVTPDGVGYRRWHGHDTVAVRGCPVLLPVLDEALAALAGRASRGEIEIPESGLEWELAAGDDGAIRSLPLVPEAVDGHEPASGARVELSAGDTWLSISAGGFFQGNAKLRDVLRREVEAAASASGSGLLLELYAGAGFFTLGLARHFDMVLAVESDARAARDLQRNLERAGVSNTEVRCERVEDGLAQLTRWRPDVILLDPPRAGIGIAGCEALRSLGARRIVYLSCDPATLARDLGSLTRMGAAGVGDDHERDAGSAGYRLVSVTGFDLFPQTPHVEALAVLDREDDEL